jgi:CheY-like chemotaxis protein
MKILFLDDDNERIEKFNKYGFDATIVKNAEDAIKELSSNNFDVVFLDHDLEGVFNDPAGKNTGSEVVRHILANPVPPATRFIVHSFNYKEAWNMAKSLHNAGYETRYYPFGDDYFNYFCGCDLKIEFNKK